MKIALLVSSMNAGGAERVAATLANAWVQRADEVVLIPCYTGWQGSSFYPLDASVQVQALAPRLPKSKLLATVYKPWVLKKVLQAVQADVIVSFLTNVNITALLANHCLQQPLIVCERTNPVASQTLSRPLQMLRRWLYPKASAVMIQTQAAAQAFAKQHTKVKRIAVIPNPLPESLAHPIPLADLNKTPPVLMAMGRLVASKQFDVLIACFANIHYQYPQWQLHIYGDGPLHGHLQARIDALNMNESIYLMGKTAQPWACMRQAQAFAMSSALEGFPNVLLEAMANGLPCLSLDCQHGPAELLKGGEVGLLIEMNNAQALQQGLQQLLGDHDLRAQLATKARASILERYTLQAVLAQWDSLFSSLGVKIKHGVDDGQGKS